MTSSYLGVTAHFFTRWDHRRHQITLAVRRMPHPHNAVSICVIIEKVLKGAVAWKRKLVKFE